MKTDQAKIKSKRLLSIQEVTREYGGTVWFWRSQIWSGRIPVMVVGKKQWLDRNDLERFIESNKRTLL